MLFSGTGFISNLSDVFEVNGGIEVGDILDARLDHQVLLACVGEGAKGHNPLWGSLVIASPTPSSPTPESPSASSPGASPPTGSAAGGHLGLLPLPLSIPFYRRNV